MDTRDQEQALSAEGLRMNLDIGTYLAVSSLPPVTDTFLWNMYQEADLNTLYSSALTYYPFQDLGSLWRY